MLYKQLCELNRGKIVNERYVLATSQTAIKPSHSYIQRWFVFILSVWALVVFVAGYYGFFAQLPLPSIGILATIGIVLPIWIYYHYQPFQSYIRSIHPLHLTLFHVWRILAGFTFLNYGSQNLLPEKFVINAGYGDLAVGFLVPVVLMWKDSKNKYILFHIFSLIDFVGAVGTGLTFTLLQVPLMENIATFPLVLIPLYGVCVTGTLSWMTLDALVRK